MAGLALCATDAIRATCVWADHHGGELSCCAASVTITAIHASRSVSSRWTENAFLLFDHSQRPEGELHEQKETAILHQTQRTITQPLWSDHCSLTQSRWMRSPGRRAEPQRQEAIRHRVACGSRPHEFSLDHEPCLRRLTLSPVATQPHVVHPASARSCPQLDCPLIRRWPIQPPQLQPLPLAQPLLQPPLICSPWTRQAPEPVAS